MCTFYKKLGNETVSKPTIIVLESRSTFAKDWFDSIGEFITTHPGFSALATFYFVAAASRLVAQKDICFPYSLKPHHTPYPGIVITQTWK